VTKRLAGRRSSLLGTLDEGEFFADMALAQGTSAGVTIRAAGPTELAVLRPEHFYPIIEQSPKIWTKIREYGLRPEFERNDLLTGETYLT
ncbi:MAG: cyclic nucleotide-binding domain-containing protein, partial [Myxococcota bacterium]